MRSCAITSYPIAPVHSSLVKTLTTALDCSTPCSSQWKMHHMSCLLFLLLACCFLPSVRGQHTDDVVMDYLGSELCAGCLPICTAAS